MLVLTRKYDETIVIGTDEGPITITVVKLDKGSVRLGVDAPRSIPIARGELLKGTAPINVLERTTQIDGLKR